MPGYIHNGLTPQNILLGRVSSKVVERLAKFPILDFFCQFVFVFFDMGPYGRKKHFKRNLV